MVPEMEPGMEPVALVHPVPLITIAIPSTFVISESVSKSVAPMLTARAQMRSVMRAAAASAPAEMETMTQARQHPAVVVDNQIRST